MEYPHSLRLQNGQMGAREDPLRLTGGKTAAPASSGGAAAQGLSTGNRRSQGLLEKKRALSGGVAGTPGGGPESARPAGDADSDLSGLLGEAVAPCSPPSRPTPLSLLPPTALGFTLLSSALASHFHSLSLVLCVNSRSWHFKCIIIVIILIV